MHSHTPPTHTCFETSGGGGGVTAVRPRGPRDVGGAYCPAHTASVSSVKTATPRTRRVVVVVVVILASSSHLVPHLHFPPLLIGSADFYPRF